jgi:hypothetical protein
MIALAYGGCACEINREQIAIAIAQHSVSRSHKSLSDVVGDESVGRDGQTGCGFPELALRMNHNRRQRKSPGGCIISRSDQRKNLASFSTRLCDLKRSGIPRVALYVEHMM